MFTNGSVDVYQRFSRRCSFKDISYLPQPFCSVECDHLCNFVKGHHEEHFSENILDLDQWFRRGCRSKKFLTVVLAAFLFGGAEPVSGIYTCEIF